MGHRSKLLTLLALLLAIPVGAEVFVQTSFVAGELSPRLYGRADIEQYSRGAETILNAVVLPQGGLERRPGFYYIATTKSSGQARLVSFIYNDDEAYILEFGEAYIRFYTDGAKVMSGASPYEVASPYRAEDLFELKFAQADDVLYISHPNFSPRKLTFTSAASWALTAPAFTNRPADWGLAPGTITGITLSGTNPVRITDAAHGLVDGDEVIISGVVGTTELNGEAYVVNQIDVNTFDLNGTDSSGFTAYTSGGTWDQTDQPAAVTFYEERLLFAGVPSYPQTIYASVVGSYENFLSTTGTDNGYEYTIASDAVNEIVWMKGISSKLLIGSNTGEWWMSGGGIDDAITQTSVLVRRHSARGSQDVEPIVVQDRVFFVQRPGRSLIEYGYTELDGFKSHDRSILAEHLTKRYGITQLAYQQTPWSVIWAVRSDGTLLGMTYVAEHQVYAWHQHTTGDGDDFESVAAIPGASYDELWAVVKRTVNGSTVRYVEQMQSSEWSVEEETITATTTDTDTIGDRTEFMGSTFTNDLAVMGYVTLKSGSDSTGSGIQLHSWIYFDDIDVAADDVITNATLTVYPSVAETGTPDLTIWAIKEVGATIPTATPAAEYIAGTSSTGFTSASKRWQPSSLTPDAAVSLRVDDILRELIALTGWASGGSIVLVIGPTSHTDANNYVTFNNYTDPDHQPTFSISIQRDGANISGDAISEEAFFVDSGLSSEGSKATIDGVTRANPVSISTVAAHGLTTGDEVFIRELAGCEELNGNTYTVTVVDADDFTLDSTDGTAFEDAWESGGYVWKRFSSFSGLSHLENATVSILADGAIHPKRLVSSGAIALDDSYYFVHAGLPYNTDVRTLSLSGGQAPLQGQKKRITNTKLLLYEATGQFDIGPDFDDMDTVTINDFIDFTTDVIEIYPPNTYDERGRIAIRVSDPVPMTLLSIFLEVDLF